MTGSDLVGGRQLWAERPCLTEEEEEQQQQFLAACEQESIMSKMTAKTGV